MLFRSGGSPSGRSIDVLDPISMALVRTVNLRQDFAWGIGGATRSLAVDYNGDIYVTGLYGPLTRFSKNGDLLASIGVSHSSYVEDVNLSNDGTLLIAQFDGSVLLMNKDFSNQRKFTAINYYAADSFATFAEAVAVPEASSMFLVLSALVAGTAFRRPINAGRG